MALHPLPGVGHMRLLMQSSGVTVPADKVVRALPDGPDLRRGADTVWP
ncbi:hypothetical protein [Streptomyces afghaniensis]